MTLYDALIKDTKSLLLPKSKRLSCEKSRLKKGERNAVLFTKDTAFELGGSALPCVSMTAVSSDLAFGNEMYLVGPDISEIRGDSPFAKFVFLQIADIDDEQAAFNKIKELESVRYTFSPEGFMSRASALNMREQIRVSKKAVAAGISFADYGKLLMEEYLKNPSVQSVCIFFATEFCDFSALRDIAEKGKKTTSALNHILDNVMFDCSSCNLKEICDEVDGLKQLHKKQAKK